jgi:acyl-CoA thioesterase-1
VSPNVEGSANVLARPSSTVLFIGDSITDADRKTHLASPLGAGYVRNIADALAESDNPIRVLNAGVSGDRIRDLRRRWAVDAVAPEPDLISILVGINDVWRRYDSADPTTAGAFKRDYRWILEQTAKAGSRVVLVEPFLMPVSADQSGWREDLDPKLEVVRRLAEEFGATLIDADVRFTEEARSRGARRLAEDGIHPTRLGHELLATWWRAAVIPL